MTVEQMDKKRLKLWNLIESEVGSSTMDLIAELIKVELEMNERCNR